jgi:hypothetical protein
VPDLASINGVAAADVASVAGVAAASCGGVMGLDYPSGYCTKGYNFNGTDEWIQVDGISTSNNFDWQSDAQSVSTWFSSSITASQCLWSFGHNSQQHSKHTLTIVGSSSMSGPRVTLWGSRNTLGTGLFGKNDATSSPNGATSYIWVNDTDTGGINPTDGGWHHIVSTFSGSASTAKAVNLYINGTHVAFSKSRSSTFSPDDFAIGVESIDNHAADKQSNFFSGTIAQMSFYTSSITGADVAAIYNSGVPIDETARDVSPVHFFRFGDGDSNGPGTLTDYGSGGVDGTGQNLSSGDIVDASPS